MILLSGNANPLLAQKVAKLIKIPLGRIHVSHFSDGETKIEILDSLHGKTVVILQPTSPPVNDHLIELLLIADACMRAGAVQIKAVIPYFGYARQDKLHLSHHVPIAAKVMASLIETVKITQVYTLEMHSKQIAGFFNIPISNLMTDSLFLRDIQQQAFKKISVVSPDIGGICRAQNLVNALPDGTHLVVLNKKRSENTTEITNVMGKVKGRTCILIDDVLDTGKTLCAAAHALKQQGANKIISYCTHALFSTEAYDNIQNAPIDEVIITNSVIQNLPCQPIKNLRVLDVAPLIADRLLKNMDNLDLN